METSVTAAKVLVPSQPEEVCSSLDPEQDPSEGKAVAAACAPSSSSSDFDAMEEFSRRLEDIIHTHGSAVGLKDNPSVVDAEIEKMKEEPKGDNKAAMDTDISLIMQSLSKLSSPEVKLEDLVKKYADMAALRRCDEQKLSVLQQKLTILLEERQQMQAERRNGIAARSKLETLCRELQSHYNVLREETLQHCRQEEEKRSEITSHFQSMLTEIQSQIGQHSARNDKLCRENANLTDKLESLMTQCEQREESLEKINKHRDLQYKLSEAKLQQANALLAEAEEKHKREKEYLLREAIDKTKKCFAMKEQELTMKKKLLVQAAEWKLQAKTLKEQGTVMQAQLTLYAQKFDEFQTTLSKSNEIYVRFKKEMENMSDKMKKVEKESNLWKTRFENCNKALTDMLEERTEKGKEYDLFVLKIQKLEKLCRALQDERTVLYDKIKEVRLSNANLPTKILGTLKTDDDPIFQRVDKCALLTSEDLKEIQESDPVLTEDMSRLRAEQSKLQEFAASLLATPFDNDEEEEIDLEEDVVASAFDHFKTKTQVKENLVSDPEQAVESDLPQAVKVEEVQNPAIPTPEALAPQMIQTDQKPEVQAQVEVRDVQQVKPDESLQQQQPAAPEPIPEPVEAKADPPTDPEPTKPEIQEETGEVKPVEDKITQQQLTEEAPEPSVSSPPSENTPKPAASSNDDSSKKQAPKKKKKRGGKSAS